MRLLFCVVFIAISENMVAQFSEVGFGGGVLNYSGDLVDGYEIQYVKPALSAYLRLNYSKYFAIKNSLLIGSISANDDIPYDAIALERKANFNVFAIEVASTAEYYLFDYKNPKSNLKGSPYGFIGVGFTYFDWQSGSQLQNKPNNIQVVIPLGLGYKHILNQRISICSEFGLRKMFTDYLDLISDSDQTIKNFQYGHPINTDWYHYFEISFSYLIYKIPCPYKYVPNESLYK